jgi:hypothetical protein
MAQEEAGSKPIELEMLKAYVGVWDAEIEAWPQGLDSPSITFKGVETIRPYGEYWIAADFVSEIGGRAMKVHSIIGYDLDQRKLVGKVIDDGPYAATMTGHYDPESKSVHWRTEAKTPDGMPMIQKTLVTQKDASQRVLELSVPAEGKDEFTKFMEIKFVKRTGSDQ